MELPRKSAAIKHRCIRVARCKLLVRAARGWKMACRTSSRDFKGVAENRRRKGLTGREAPGWQRHGGFERTLKKGARRLMGVHNEGLHYANSRWMATSRRLISYHFDCPAIHMNIAPPRVRERECSVRNGFRCEATGERYGRESYFSPA